MFCSERSSYNGGQEGGGRAAIAHRRTEWLTESFLSTADAFTPALPHPVVWNGVNSQICHQMWQLYSHMVSLDAALHGFTVTTLWYFKASAPIKMKEGGNNSPEEVAPQTGKDGKSVLPIKTIEVCVIGLLFCSPSSSFLLPPFTAHKHRDSCSLSTPHPCPSPV